MNPTNNVRNTESSSGCFSMLFRRKKGRTTNGREVSDASSVRNQATVSKVKNVKATSSSSSSSSSSVPASLQNPVLAASIGKTFTAGTSVVELLKLFQLCSQKLNKYLPAEEFAQGVIRYYELEKSDPDLFVPVTNIIGHLSNDEQVAHMIAYTELVLVYERLQERFLSYFNPQQQEMIEKGDYNRLNYFWRFRSNYDGTHNPEIAKQFNYLNQYNVSVDAMVKHLRKDDFIPDSLQVEASNFDELVNFLIEKFIPVWRLDMQTTILQVFEPYLPNRQ